MILLLLDKKVILKTILKPHGLETCPLLHKRLWSKPKNAPARSITLPRNNLKPPAAANLKDLSQVPARVQRDIDKALK